MITQNNRRRAETFNDGVVEVFAVSNAATEGDRPKQGLFLKFKLRFGYQTLTLTRKMVAFQFDTEVTDVIRVPLLRVIDTNDVVRINGGLAQYNIQLVQHITNTTPAKTVLTLKRLEKNYELAGF